MDQTLILKLTEFKKALESLAEVLAKEKNAIIRDSVIKRFEYCFELGWKSAKILLDTKFGVEVFSPKEVFRALKQNQLVTDENTEQLLKMTDDRNEVIHTYKEILAEQLYSTIKEQYQGILQNLHNIIKNNS